jgi:outer membrane protein OmpA-like peptidoglycan-associated protein
MRKALVSFVWILANAFFSFSQTFTLADSNLTVGSYLRTYRVLFNLGKADLREESKLYLDTVAAYMLKYDNPVFEIGVHADSRGSLQSNTNITQARAQCIRNYLVLKGVPDIRLSAKGYGSSKLLVSEVKLNALRSKEEYEAAQQQNRRVEFRIIDFNGKETTLVNPRYQVGNFIIGYGIVYDMSNPFRPEDKPILDSLVTLMQGRPGLRIEVANHTDYRGSTEANLRLSKFRSDCLVDYVVSRGIPKERIVSSGYGEGKPRKITVDGKSVLLTEQYINMVTRNKTKEEYEALMAKNRRVEFRILSI